MRNKGRVDTESIFRSAVGGHATRVPSAGSTLTIFIFRTATPKIDNVDTIQRVDIESIFRSVVGGHATRVPSAG